MLGALALAETEVHWIWNALGLLSIPALVLFNALFVAAEFSIVTVRKTRIDQLVAEGHRGARAVRHAVTQPDRYIAATQLGITMASLGLGWLAEPALAGTFEPALLFLPPHLAAGPQHAHPGLLAHGLTLNRCRNAEQDSPDGTPSGEDTGAMGAPMPGIDSATAYHGIVLSASM